MITTAGRTAIRRYFAGYESNIVDTIAIGIGSSSGEVMGCEWARFPIAVVGTDVDNNRVIFKSSSPINVVGGIYEIGIIQGGGGNMKDIILSTFTSEEESWTGNYSFTVTNSRLNQGLKVTANNTASTALNPISLAVTADKDQLQIAGFASAAGTVKVTLEFSNGATAQGTFSVPNGYGIVNINRTSLTKTGTVDWQSVVKITVNPTVDYTVDILKVKVVNPWNETLVARTVLTTPQITDTSLPLDIEYALETN
jgi:hypothetical protein